MRILIAEDDFASRKFMLKFLSKFGECDITVDGMEAVDAYLMALDADTPYDLVCLDIMMPALDGYQALKAIRDIEQERKIPEDQIRQTTASFVMLLQRQKQTTCQTIPLTVESRRQQAMQLP